MMKSCKNYRIPNWQIYSGLVIVHWGLLWIAKKHLVNIDFLTQLAGGQQELSRLGHHLEVLRAWFDLNFILIPVILLIKYTFLSLILQFPLLLLLDDAAFKKIFRIIMVASGAILLGVVVQYGLIFIKPNAAVNLDSWQYTPLSLAGILDRDSGFSDSARRIFDKFNPFELIWCLVIGYKLRVLTVLTNSDIAVLVTGTWFFLLALQWIFTEIFSLLSI